MQFKSGERESCCSWVVSKTLYGRNGIPAFLQILSTCLQFCLYLSAIAASPIEEQFLMVDEGIKINLIMVMLALIAIRTITGLTLIKFIYISALVILMKQTFNTASYIGMALITLNLIIDAITKTEITFSRSTITSEDLNTNKYLHYAFITAAIVLHFQINNIILRDSLSVALIFLLFIAKKASIVKSNAYKQILLRFYLCLMAFHLQNIIFLYVNIPTIVFIFAPIFISQLIYQIYEWKKNTINFKQLHSKHKYFQLCFKILIYFYSGVYNEEFQKQIEKFAKIEDQIIMEDDEEIKLISSKEKRQNRSRIQRVYQQIISILSDRNDFLEQITLAEVHLLHSKCLIKAHKIIENLSSRTTLSLIQKIILKKFRFEMEDHFNKTKEELVDGDYTYFYQNQEFKILLLKHSLNYVQFWEYSSLTQIITENILSILFRLIRAEEKIKQKFRKYKKTLCISTMLTYLEYLFSVTKDIEAGNSILKSIIHTNGFQVNYFLDEKVFIRLRFEEDNLQIQKIGQNSSILLGFERRQLENHYFEMFLPQFYKKTHKIKLTDKINNNFEDLYLYQKSTIIKNNFGYYDLCDIMLQLRYEIAGEGNLFLSGFLHIRKTQEFQFTDFVIANQKGEAIELCDSFKDKLFKNEKNQYIIWQIFQENQQVNSIQKIKNSHHSIEYHPIKSFQFENQQAVLLVKKNTEKSSKYQKRINSRHSLVQEDKIIKKINEIKVEKISEQFLQEFYHKRNQIEEKIWSNFHKVCNLVFLICFFFVFFFCWRFFSMASKNQQNNENNMSQVNEIIKMEDSLSNIEMDITYLDFTKSNYSLSWYHLDLLNQSFILQENVFKLKQLLADTVQLPSLLPNFTYSKTKFQVYQMIAAEAFTINQFASSDYFYQTTLATNRLRVESVLLSLVDIDEKQLEESQDLEAILMRGQIINIALFFISLIIALICLCIFDLFLRQHEAQIIQLIKKYFHIYKLVVYLEIS